MLREEDIYRIFDELDIEYKVIHHEALFTIEAAKDIDKKLGVEICKNLFLSTKHGTEFYLLFMKGNKKFNTGKVSKQVGVPRMTFASDENMEAFLGVKPGSVTPLGLLNDKDNKVNFLIDSQVVNEEYVSMHPLINTATVVIKTKDLLEKIIPYANKSVRMVEME